MRRLLLVVPFLFACAKGEEAPADSAAMAAAPAAITDADVAGTWTGTFKADGDTASVAFTDVCGAGTCRLVAANAPKDTSVSTYVIMADSVVGTSAPYADKMLKATVVDHWVARPKGNQGSGTGYMTLADKPDSVVLRYSFTGTRTP